MGAGVNMARFAWVLLSLTFWACDDAATHRSLERVFGQRLRIVPVQGQWVALVATGPGT